MTNENTDMKPASLSSELRRRAEAIAQGQTPSPLDELNTLSPEKLRQALHELHVHQIELEMQNEELRRAQAELQALQARYFSLYDLAPAGYCTVSEKGLILEANLTATELLGSTRVALIQKPFSQFIFNEDQDIYYLLRKKLFDTGAPQSCELRLVKNDATIYWAHLDAAIARDPGMAPVRRIVISDITARKQIEEALKTSESRYRELVNYAVDGVLVGNHEGIIIEANECMCKLAGVKPSELIGKHIQEVLFDPKSLAETPLRFDLLQQGEVLVNERIIVRPDGSKMDIEMHSKMMPDGTYQSIYRDITERKRAADFLRLIIDNIPDLVFWKDRNSVYQGCNNAFAQAAGVGSPENIVGKTDYEFSWKKEESDFFVSVDRRVMENDQPEYHIIEPQRQSDGRQTWAETSKIPLHDEHGRVIGILGTYMNITERKQTIEALRLKNLVFDESISANSIADLNGLITEANDMFLRIWGYSDKSEVIGKPIMHFLNDPNEAAAIIHALDTTGQWEGDYIAKRKDSSTFMAHGMATTVRDENGKMIGYQSSAVDVTERKHAEAELLKTQKLTSIGLLAGGIAHDFNNILMGLFGNISLAKKDLPPDHPGIKPLENAEKSMTRAIRLTKQLLTFSKGGDPVKEDVSLGTLVEEVARFDLTGSNVKLVYHQADDLWKANADKGQIQQVISNLTTNARQAMPNGGHLYITLENAEIRDNSIPRLHRANYVKITLRDEGSGIDAKTIDRIFDPYFTTKKTGSGLGLATTYSIIKKHGGHIGVISELGKGTTFTLYLPASDSPAVPHQQPVPPEPAPLTHTPKLLVLDDEEFIRMVIPRWLKHMGCVVTTSDTGRQTVDLYKQAMESGAPFDLLILDLTIPGGIGGQEVLREILALNPAAKAIVSSGYSEGPIMADYASFGFKGVLPKPYTEQQLQELVTQVLG
ncbi:MAG: PAS domain S-box protein [bacterium]